VNTKNRIPLIVGSVVLLIGLVLVLALVVSDGDDDGAADEAGSGDPAAEETATTDAAAPADSVGDEAGEAGGAATEATAPVVITGDPLVPYDPAENPDAALGATAPVVEGQSFDGSPVTLGGAGDGPRMLVFLAHWCPHCNDEIPELLEVQASGGIPEDVEVIGISTGVAADRDNYPPAAWLDEKGWEWPAMADSEASEAMLAYGGTGFPYTVMLDADGDVLARKSGSSSATDITGWIAAALA
jgi:cytochrome c biogenesis protein CcmG/thiol:disulfide interchange protein DsbE